MINDTLAIEMIFTQHFIKKYNQEAGKNISGITPQAMKHLLNYSWPGNIREVENAIERAIVLSTHPILDIADFPENIINPDIHSSNSLSPKIDDDLVEDLKDREKKLIFNALIENHGNITKAALKLNLKRTTLRYKMEKYDLLRYKFE